jgi:gluconate 2-dehydrogenase gamma chain
MTTLKAILARLIPKDNLGPGAVEANAHVYIDRALAGHLKTSLPAYQRYLPMFNAAAKPYGAASFAALSPSQQDALLELFALGQPPGVTAADPALAGLFAMLLEHTREGMFGDPMYGGNARFAGWDLIGYPGVKLVWTAQEQALGARLTPVHISVALYGGKPAS